MIGYEFAKKNNQQSLIQSLAERRRNGAIESTHKMIITTHVSCIRVYTHKKLDEEGGEGRQDNGNVRVRKSRQKIRLSIL